MDKTPEFRLLHITYFLLYSMPSKYHLKHDITQNGLLQVLKTEIWYGLTIVSQ